MRECLKIYKYCKAIVEKWGFGDIQIVDRKARIVNRESSIVNR